MFPICPPCGHDARPFSTRIPPVPRRGGPIRPPADGSIAGVRLRLNQVYADESLAEAARDIGINSETLRRQLAGPGLVSLELVIATLVMRGVSAEWLLRGVGRRARR